LPSIFFFGEIIYRITSGLLVRRQFYSVGISGAVSRSCRNFSHSNFRYNLKYNVAYWTAVTTLMVHNIEFYSPAFILSDSWLKIETWPTTC